jgi:hypothetical protein
MYSAFGGFAGILRMRDARETFGQQMWLGPPLFAAVPETGHNKAQETSAEQSHE